MSATDREEAARRVLSWVQEAPAHTSLVVGEKPPRDKPITRAEVLMTLAAILDDIDRTRRLEAWKADTELALAGSAMCLGDISEAEWWLFRESAKELREWLA